jgi:DNA-binding NarL/FixJ family response regulator
VTVTMLRVPGIARAWVEEALGALGHDAVAADQPVVQPMVTVDTGGADTLRLAHGLAPHYRHRLVVATVTRNRDMLALYEHLFVLAVPYGDVEALGLALTMAATGLRLERPNARRFTMRQAQVVTKTALGWGRDDIAHALGTSAKTINAHWSSVLAKCKYARSRTEFIAGLFRAEAS